MEFQWNVKDVIIFLTELPRGKRFPMEMEALDITRPLVSLPMRWKVARQGLHFPPTEAEPLAYMDWGNRKYPLLEENNSYTRFNINFRIFQVILSIL